MKVRIEDKDAIAALSWEELKAYLDRAKSWKYAEDIPGKAAVYQHKDKSGRLREILVPLRRDLGDYISRMADAVSTLARVEKRSELDVYDDLSGSGEAAARKVHERITKWLTEEGWQIIDTENPHAVLNINVTLQDKRGVRILQHKDHLDHITIARHLSVGDGLKRELSQIPHDLQNDMVFNIQRDAALVGVDLEGLGLPLDTIWHITYVYFDGLTKDILVQRVLLVLRAHALSLRRLIFGLEKAERPTAAENLRHLVSRDDPQLGNWLAAVG